MLETVQSAYDILDQLHLSVQLLAVIGFVLLVTFVLSARELAAWFLKINSLKREVRALHQSIAELKTLMSRLQQAPVAATAIPAVTIAAPVEPVTEKPSRQFPFSH